MIDRYLIIGMFLLFLLFFVVLMAFLLTTIHYRGENSKETLSDLLSLIVSILLLAWSVYRATIEIW